MALGAARSEIIWLVAQRGVLLGSAGVTLGLAASAASSRVLEGTLFGVNALDPLTYAYLRLAPSGSRRRSIVVAGVAGDARSCDRGIEGGMTLENDSRALLYAIRNLNHGFGHAITERIAAISLLPGAIG